MIINFGQVLHGLQGRDKVLGLSRGSPIDLWFSCLDEAVEQKDTDKSDQSRDVTHEKHDCNAKNGAKQADPLVVVLETRPPAWRLGHTGMKH